MSANNWSFPFFTDGALDATKTAGLFVLKKDGVAVSPAATFTNNGDGTYQVDLQPYGSGRYSIEYDSTAQGEVTNIYLVTDDNLTQQNLASSPVLGQVQISGTDLYVYTDGAGGTLLHSNQIVNNLTSGGAAVPLSAEMGKTLNQKILNLGGGGGSIGGVGGRRVVFSESLAATASAGNEAAAFTEYAETAGSEKIKRRFAYYKNPEDKVLIVLCQVKTAGGSDGYVILSVNGDFNNEADVSSSITDWTDFSHTEDISDLDAGLHEVTIGIQISSGSGTMYARKITVVAGPY